MGKPKLKEPQPFSELQAHVSDGPLDVLDVSFPFSHLKASIVWLKLNDLALPRILGAHLLTLLLLESF